MKCVKQTYQSEKKKILRKLRIRSAGREVLQALCCGWWPGDHPSLTESRGMCQALGSGCCARLLLPPCTNTRLQPALGSVSSPCNVCCGGE